MNNNCNQPNQSYREQVQNSPSKVQKIMNATIVTGTYKNNNGVEKKSYLTIGKLFVYSDGGMSLKLDALPLNGQAINFYDIKPKAQPQQNNGYQKNNGY